MSLKINILDPIVAAMIARIKPVTTAFAFATKEIRTVQLATEKKLLGLSTTVTRAMGSAAIAEAVTPDTMEEFAAIFNIGARSDLKAEYPADVVATFNKTSEVARRKAAKAAPRDQSQGGTLHARNEILASRLSEAKLIVTAMVCGDVRAIAFQNDEKGSLDFTTLLKLLRAELAEANKEEPEYNPDHITNTLAKLAEYALKWDHEADLIVAAQTYLGIVAEVVSVPTDVPATDAV